MQTSSPNTTVSTRFWHRLEDSRIQCDLCPRACKLNEGQRGLCFVRGREDNQIKLFSYGLSSGFCVDPIEKKPLNHFYPGSAVLSFGTAGCNLACKFCQNWDMSKSREMHTLSDYAMPDKLADTALKLGCTSIAFTYNDPVIFLEYAVDTAQACRESGVKSVAVTAGYICSEPRVAFYRQMDAVNVDLKAFSESFYQKICGAQLGPVLDTLLYIHHQTRCWLEITTLLIPGENDSEAELDAMTCWIRENLGAEVPLHFTAFHPDWKMRDKPATPASTLLKARQIAMTNGLHYVYTGNIQDAATNSTWCYQCGQCLIERSGYRIGAWQLDAEGCCNVCGTAVSGCFSHSPGSWGGQRLPVRI